MGHELGHRPRGPWPAEPPLLIAASQLSSITDLTEQTGLAVGTVRRAISILAMEGIAQTVPGRGTFVKR